MHTKIAHRIAESHPTAGFRILSVKTAAAGFVVVLGSLPGGFLYVPKNRKVSELLAALLDKGTATHSKEEIREILDRTGATLSFTSTAHSINFSLQCLSEDLRTMIALVYELLTESLFPESELSVMKDRAIAMQSEEKVDPNSMGSIVFSSLLFPKEHPYCKSDPDEAIADIRRVTGADIKELFSRLGLGSFTVVIAGDVSKEHVATISETFIHWKKSSLAPLAKTPAPRVREKRIDQVVRISDKTSVSLYLGEATELTRNHDDLYPFLVGLSVLGGAGFGARLMANVRDKQGLTYGIYARLKGVRLSVPGYFEVWATFAPVLLEKGLRATEKEIRTWRTKGITQQELEAKKANIIGSFALSLSTTRGLAAEILAEAEGGHPKEFIDEYPERIRAVTRADVNRSIQAHVNPDRFAIVKAGTL